VNSTYFETSKIYQNLSFFCSLKYNIFHREILHSRVHHCLHQDSFFKKKLKLQNVEFEFCKKEESHVAWDTFGLSVPNIITAALLERQSSRAVMLIDYMPCIYSRGLNMPPL
jgi:hypothetical protein